MRKLLIATFNNGKLEDYKSFLKGLPLKLVTLNDLGITQDFAEIHNTFELNARDKAKFYAKLSGLPTLADDSGVEIPFYDMAPGVHTKRWDGVGKNDEHYKKFVLKKIKAIPDGHRQAQLHAVLALCIDGKVYLAEGIIKGIVTERVYQKTSTYGYPWDSVFIIPELNKYYEELTDEENYQYNHRRLALEKLKPILERA